MQSKTQPTSVAVALPATNIYKGKSMSKRFAFIKRWWKSILYALSVLTAIVAFATAGYMIEDRLNSFVSKDDMIDVVKKSDLIPIETSLKSIDISIQNHETELNLLNTNILKIYDLMLTNKKH